MNIDNYQIYETILRKFKVNIKKKFNLNLLKNKILIKTLYIWNNP
jgi:hypothetical protein